MQESDIEGLANHDGPESCGCIRKGAREALTGEKAGRAIEPRNQQNQSADAVIVSGRPYQAQRKGELDKGSARSKNLSMTGNSMRENREEGQSDSPVVPTKTANKGAQAPAEPMEGRGGAKGNADPQSRRRTQSRESMSQELDRVRQAARRDRKTKFTALLHHVTVERLRGAFQELKRKAAPGVDGVTWNQYEQNLEGNLKELHKRVHQGSYQAKPSRRVYIPKADGSKRALGIATLEDKLVQRTVAEVLSAIDEEDYLGFSYGCRAGRSQHDALDALAVGLYVKKVSWVLDVDIQGFYDTINLGWMQKFIEHRIADRRVLRLIQKWMKAGVMEAGSVTEDETGIQQGASIYAAERRKERGKGKPETIDFLGFTHICGKTKTGKLALKRQTMRTRMRARLKAIKIDLKRRRHEPIAEQGRWLGRVVRGYFAYHAVPTNRRALEAFRTEATKHWLRALRQRSQRSTMDWKRMCVLVRRWLPEVRILHPWPEVRFRVRTRGKSPVR